MTLAHVDTSCNCSLASRLIAENFGSRRGVMTIGGISVTNLAEEYGTPFYAYDLDIVKHRYRCLASAVSGFASVYYSVKANPHPEVIRVLVENGAGMEVASGAEYDFARAAGCSSDRIVFAGPGKCAAELRHTISQGIGEIHLETFEELEIVGGIADEYGSSIPVSIRVNPAAAASGGALRMGGVPSAFGFDEEIIDRVIGEIARRPGLELTGVHLFAGTQILSSDVLLTQWSHGIDVAVRAAETANVSFSTIDLGGGLGVPYHEGDCALDLDGLSAGLSVLADRKMSHPLLRDAEVLIEPGRFLTASAGTYVMAVRAVKDSRGERFVIADGGMHHHLAASGNLGQVIKRDYPIVAATRIDESERFPARIVGPLCTPLDTLGRQTDIPTMMQGDLIAVLQSGAYGLTASPARFLGHPPPREVLVEMGRHWAL